MADIEISYVLPVVEFLNDLIDLRELAALGRIVFSARENAEKQNFRLRRAFLNFLPISIDQSHEAMDQTR